MADKRSGLKSGFSRKLDWLAAAGELAKSEIAHGIRKFADSPPPRELIFLHRKLGGIFQILRRLDAKCRLQPYLEIYERTAQS